jgi:transcriptional regulator with GAF, ATPase, and Fis domain
MDWPGNVRELQNVIKRAENVADQEKKEKNLCTRNPDVK